MRAHRGVCVRRCVCLQGCVCDCVCECMRVCELLQASKHYSNCVTFDSTETKALQHDLQAALQAHTHTHTHTHMLSAHKHHCGLMALRVIEARLCMEPRGALEDPKCHAIAVRRRTRSP